MEKETNLMLRITEALERIDEKLDKISHNQHQTVATPAIACASNSVTITCATSGATIHYTTDGSEPTVESDVYSSPISISKKTTFKALAVKLDMNDSSVASADCTPVVSAPSITCANNSVTMACATTGATIHYTDDGTTPTEESDVYSEAIAITETTTFKAIAVKEDWENSSVTTEECVYE